MARRIFIHHHGALGDLLLSLPAIAALRKPDDIIHLAGRCDIVEFLGKTGFIHEASDADSVFFLPLFMENGAKPLDDFLPGFDRILLFTTDKSSTLARNLLRTAPNSEIIQTIPEDCSRMHVSDFRIRQTGVAEPNAPRHGLAIPPLYRDGAKKLLTRGGYDFEVPLVAIHPGSGGKQKCWPLENYFALIEKITAKQPSFFVIFSGPAEGDEDRKKIEAFVAGKRNIIPVCRRGLITVAALISLATVYVGNDSGITHLAAAVNRNVVALFGPTDPVHWRPWGEGVRVVCPASPDRTLSSITVKEVCAEVMPFLSF